LPSNLFYFYFHPHYCNYYFFYFRSFCVVNLFFLFYFSVFNLLGIMLHHFSIYDAFDLMTESWVWKVGVGRHLFFISSFNISFLKKAINFMVLFDFFLSSYLDLMTWAMSFAGYHWLPRLLLSRLHVYCTTWGWLKPFFIWFCASMNFFPIVLSFFLKKKRFVCLLLMSILLLSNWN